ncbi:MAG: hypothetical protein RL177_966, partial [Bacteroidota bacterium]
MKRLLFLIWMALAATGVQAQSSVVPASHGVYEWLHTQRVNGTIAGYQHEQRPMSRGDVLGFLRQAERMTSVLSRTDRALLQDYLNEFDFSRFRHNRTFVTDALGWFSHSVPDGMSARRDPH